MGSGGEEKVGVPADGDNVKRLREPDVSGLFADASESTVLLSTWCSKRSEKTASGSKARIICVTYKRDKRTRELGFKVHDIKVAESGRPLLKGSWRLTQLSTVLPASDSTGGRLTLSFDRGGKSSEHQSFNMVQGDEMRIAYLLYVLARFSARVNVELRLITWKELREWHAQTSSSYQVDKVLISHGIYLDFGLTQREKGVEKEGGANGRESSTDHEDQLIAELYQKNNASGVSGMFLDNLRKDLSRLESENVVDIFNAETHVTDSINSIAVGISRLDDVTQFLDTIHFKLQHMRRDLKTIEARNHLLDIQTRNSNALLEQLSAILKAGALPEPMKKALLKGPLDPPKWDSTLEALTLLKASLKFTGEQQQQSSSPKKGGDIGRMSAIKELRIGLTRLQNGFVGRVSPHLYERFRTFVDYYGEDLSQVEKGKLISHDKLHARLTSYRPLLVLIRDFDETMVFRTALALTKLLNEQLRREMESLLRSFEGTRWHQEEDVEKEGDSYVKRLAAIDPRNFIQWIWQVVPHLLREAEFIHDYFASETSVKSAAESNNLLSLEAALYDGIDDEIFMACKSCKVNIPKAIYLRANLGAWQTVLESNGRTFGLNLLVQPIHFLSDRRQAFMNKQTAILSAIVAPPSVKQVHTLPFVTLILDLFKGIEETRDFATDFTEFGGVAEDAEKIMRNHLENMIDVLGPPSIKALKLVASNDEKHGPRFMFENLGVLHEGLSNKKKEAKGEAFKSLVAFNTEVESLYKEYLTAYVEGQMTYHFGPIIEFTQNLSKMYSRMDTDDIAFQSGYARADLRRVLRQCFSPSVERPLKAMQERVNKHFAENSREVGKSYHCRVRMVDIAQKECKRRLRKYMTYLERLVTEVYPGEVLEPSAHTLNEMFKAI